MPLPTSLVVKNGSNARATTSGGMPLPVSPTAIMTYCPALLSGKAVGPFVVEFDVGGLDREPSAVPASRRAH